MAQPKPTTPGNPTTPAADSDHTHLLAEAARSKEPVSVITCDMEGRIETFNDGARQIFGYTADEVVGKRRVSLFSPGEVVLGHVPTWLKKAREDGDFQTETVFVRKDGSRFAARIRITPTFKHGQQIGYCGQTRVLKDVDPAKAMPNVGLGVKVFRAVVVGRLPFLTATIVPILIAAAWVAYRGTPPGGFPWLNFAFAMAGGMALHLAANTFNDYFDWKSGTDQANNDYFLPFSGGSRAIELGLITEKGTLRVALASLAVATACGVALAFLADWGILAFGVAGIFSAVFYTAPPIRLAARRGLGELAVAANFGPLMTAGTVYALTGTVGWQDFFVGVPIGLLTAGILYINEFPDAKSDALTGKNHLVVTLGQERARWGYIALIFAGFAVAAGGAAFKVLPMGSLLMLLALPLAVYAMWMLMRHVGDRKLVKANAATIQLQLLAGLLLAAGLLWLS